MIAVMGIVWDMRQVTPKYSPRKFDSGRWRGGYVVW